MQYNDGTSPKILDIIKIECKCYRPNSFQPENYVFDNQYVWEKTGIAKLNDVIDLHPPENKEYIFFDDNKRIHKDTLAAIPDIEKYSLMLISPYSPYVNVKQWPERRAATMNFSYNKKWYSYIPITDLDFKDRYLKYDEGDHVIFNDIYLVLSLGECDKKDDCHYKLVATVIET